MPRMHAFMHAWKKTNKNKTLVVAAVANHGEKCPSIQQSKGQVIGDVNKVTYYRAKVRDYKMRGSIANLLGNYE